MDLQAILVNLKSARYTAEVAKLAIPSNSTGEHVSWARVKASSAADALSVAIAEIEAEIAKRAGE